MESTLFWNTLATAIGWAVFHSIWQITVVFVLYRVAFWCRPQQSRALYLLALAGMLGSAVWTCVTFAGAWQEYAQTQVWEAMLRPDVAAQFEVTTPTFKITPATEPISWKQRLDIWYESIAVPVGGLWLAGAFFLVLRLLGGYWLSWRIRRVGVSPMPGQHLCRNWCEKLGIRRTVTWLESAHVAQPLTLGFWKPVVLFPAGLVLQLLPEEVEMLLLHELAHIRRHDYLVNLLQLIFEVCFFYHPLFWLLSKEARRHREHCCDDLVLQHEPDRLLYAKVLTNLQHIHPFTQNQFAMHAIGQSAFAQRIFRLFNARPDKAQRSPVLVAFLAVVLMGAAFTWSAFSAKPLPAPAELPVVLPVKNNDPTDAASQTVEGSPSAKPENNSFTPVGDQAEPDSLPPAVVFVGADKMNVFYIGVDNPITVAVPGYICSDLSARLVGEGQITGLGDCRHIVVVKKPGTVSIEIYAQEKGVEKLLGVRHFRVKRIPDPVVRAGNRMSSTIPQGEIREVLSQEVQAMIQNFDFDAQCMITRFNIVLQRDSSDIVELVVTGNTVPAIILDQAEKLPVGSRLYLVDVRTLCPGDTAPRNIGDVVYRISQ
ncbi:MAG: M56 family metallopeptidase [Saprospiraceae bacterium]